MLLPIIYSNHMNITKKSIETFLADRKVAIAGVSRNPKKFGYVVFKDLRDKGFEIIPVNPHAETIDGIKCYPTIRDLPDGIRSLLILTRKNLTRDVVADALSRNIPNIWIQQMSETQEALGLLQDKPVNLVAKECILMHSDPVKGVHKFHRNVKRFFGMLPK